jgi:transcriptional regulator with XRE-family HTH domain
MTDPRKTFGDLLRATRVAKGYSLRKFAELSDTSPTYLSQIEQAKNERPPAEERVRRIAELLGQDADEWVALAGRVPEELTDIIKKEPQAMPALLRAAKGLTTEELRKLTDQIRDQQKDGRSE